MSAGPVRSSGGGDRIGNPYVAIGVHVDAVWPDEPVAAETRDDITVHVEFQYGIELRVEALVAKAFRSVGVTTDDCPQVFAVRVHF